MEFEVLFFLLNLEHKQMNYENPLSGAFALQDTDSSVSRIILII